MMFKTYAIPALAIAFLAGTQTPAMQNLPEENDPQQGNFQNQFFEDVTTQLIIPNSCGTILNGDMAVRIIYDMDSKSAYQFSLVCKASYLMLGDFFSRHWFVDSKTERQKIFKNVTLKGGADLTLHLANGEPGMCGNTMKELFGICPNLKFNAPWADGIDIKIINMLDQTEMGLGFCSKNFSITSGSDEWLMNFASSCPKLKYFVVSSPNIKQEVTIIDITQKCPYITNFDVNLKLTDGAVITITKNLKNLRSLSLNACQSLSKTTFESVIIQCQNLVCFQLPKEPQDIMSDVLALVSTQLPNISQLMFHWSDLFVFEDIIGNLNKMKNIRSVIFRSNMNNDIFKSLQLTQPNINFSTYTG